MLGAVAAAGYGHLALGMRFGPPLVMVGLGGLTLILCAAALWWVIDPLTRNETVLAVEVRAPHRLRELEREKQAVLKAIKEIELDHLMRKISEADYRQMVERYRGRALRVLGDLAAGDDYRALIERELKDRLAARAAAGGTTGSGMVPDAAPTPSPAPETTEATAIDESAARVSRPDSNCPGCRTRNDNDARFCKTCGKPLTTATDSI